MIDREKVIKGLKGLECCVDPLKAHCFECQYYPCYDQDTTSEKLIAAALELLKAQEPRLLTLGEALGSDECWFEHILGARGYADIYMQDNKNVLIYRIMARTELLLIEDYGKKWRCWSYRPDDEQRKAAKWDETQ